MTKKWFIPLLYIIIGYFIYQYGEGVAQWIQSDGHEYVSLTMIAATMFSLFPIIPYPIIGGITGASYGPVLGSFVVWFGSAAASILMFLFVRYGYHDWGVKMITRYKALHRITVLFEKNAFFTLLITRLIPVIPSIIINCYAAISRVRFWPYAIASSAGKVPSMILFATIGTLVTTDPGQLLYVILVYGLFLAIFFVLYRTFKRRAERTLHHKQASYPN
ncbi:TVP38/TMEM64 family protein [Salsuginibacillus kocurii]|uniref:TVP38/TMEM64 family protein n=1 Tax=Salsuginibacillus kocurii TaxID=427078 RepID=UPI000377FB75|nr:TVP38/TMEM64 family protein [Salsuginibacillus kocurii]